MDDFEYSVMISERDWDCFYQTCQECDMPPPSLAGVDDSGMSDIDDMGSIFTDRGLNVDQTAGFLEADLPFDGPPDCEGSPVEHYLSKYGVGGMENVLSGSEEDIHLQCVNTFFERLRGLTEAEQLIEPSQVKVGKNREAEQAEELCSDGPQASSTALPENITKLNSLPANSETATGEETTVTVDAKRKTNAMKKDEPDSRTVFELADSNSDIEKKKSANPETELFVREGDWLVTTANEVRKQSHPHESLDIIVCSVKTPDSDGVLSSEMDVCKHLNGANHGDVFTEQTPAVPYKSPKDESPSNLEVMAQDKLEEDKTFSAPSPDPDSKSTNKGASPQWSPSTLIKKKRRRKKRVSIEPVESGRGYERQFVANQSDSDQEPFTKGRGMAPRFTDQTRNIDCSVASVAYSEVLRGIALSYLPLNLITVENKINILSPSAPISDSQCQNLSERFDLTGRSVLTNTLVRDGRSRATDLSGNSTSIDRSASLPDSTDYGIISTPNYGDNVARNVQPYSTLQVQTLTESPGLPVSSITCTTSKSGLVREVGNADSKTLSICHKEAAYTESLHQSDQMNYTLTSCCEINSKPRAAEGISVTQSNNSQSGESNSPALGASQHDVLTDKVSASKSGLAVAVGNSGRDGLSLCQREAFHDKAQYSSTLEKTNFPMSPIVMIGSDMHEEFNNWPSSALNDDPTEVASANLTLESNNSLPDKSCRPKVSSHSLENNGIHQTKHSPEFKASSKAVPDNDTISESPGTVNCTLTCNSTIEVNPKLSISEDLLISQSHITSNGSCSTPEVSRRFDILANKELVTALSNTNIANMSSEHPGSSVTHFSGQGGEIPQIPITHDRKGDASEPKSLDISGDPSELKYDSESKTEGDVPTSATDNGIEKAPNSKHSVYAMSSFWREMENLTIKDILGLRMVSNAPLPGFLPPLPESEEVDISDAADSGYFPHLDDLQPHHSSADMLSSIPDVEDSNPKYDHIVSEDSCNPVDVMWEGEQDPVSLGAGIYPENMTLTSVERDLPQPLLSSSTGSSSQKYLKKMYKSTSVHNLHALESGPYSETWKAQGLQTVITEEGQLETDNLTDRHMARRDSGMDSLPPSSFTEPISTKDYRISLTDIFQYFFGGKPSKSSTADVDNTVTDCISGNTVPEMYDHFFSDFDAGSFFYPLIGSSGQAKHELEPVLSCSRSTSRHLQFPDAYDHFFSSSSSDDSSMESDEDGEDRGPVRVVTRFTRKASQTEMSTDIYDDFFTDRDLGQNFFWKNTFSLRNVRFTGSASQRQRSNSLSLDPVKQSRASLRRTIQPIDVLGKKDTPLPDPLLYHPEDRISRQLSALPLRYEDLQTVVANPRLDASLLPLKQSDMCLVCIAFASWVLKTANPQVGDAWKAVLLANVSALSAIRYLRRYVRVEAAREKPQSQTYPAV